MPVEPSSWSPCSPSCLYLSVPPSPGATKAIASSCEIALQRLSPAAQHVCGHRPGAAHGNQGRL